jgi:hypothetical protein
MHPAVETFLARPAVDTPAGPLRALWHAAHGDWTAAHEIAQASEDRDSAWVHAYLHREEGDQWNAEYWYRRAGKPVFKGSLADEREAMIATLLRLTASRS